MKNVMKKMFSLLLVAVMLIGVMPFAAFAEDGEGEQIDPQASSSSIIIAFSGFETTITLEYNGTPVQVIDTSGIAAEIKGKHINGWTYEGVTKHSVKDFEFTKSAVLEPSYFEKCPCGIFEDDTTTPHTDPDCSMTPITALTCEACGEIGHVATACPYCPDCLANSIKDNSHKGNHCAECHAKPGTHNPGCTLAPGYSKDCEKCGRTYVVAEGHVCCDRCKELHATADCPYCTVCWDKGDKVKLHKASDHCGECGSLDHKTSDHCTECGKTDGTHKTDCSHYVSSGTSKVKIYANLYTGDVLTKTVPLVVYNEDPNTSIADSIAEHKDLIYAELEDQYSGYEWSGNVYDSENEDGENMNSKVGKGINVHINAHSKENIVYLYVHNARTYDRIGIVRLHGKKVGEAVKESEVRKAVKEYFSFSSLKMYDTEKWDLYVDGKDVKSDDTLTVGSNHYVIDVKISGSAKNTSGAKADSSNPKTGDAIFAPAAVLGLSATTLAVLFYLNKKRAY